MAKVRVLVIWADNEGANLGVHALAGGTSELAGRVWTDAEVEFQSYGSGSDGVKRFALLQLLTELVGFRSRITSWLSGYDYVIDTGAGDSFADIYGLRRLIEMTTVKLLVHRSSARLVLGPQTVGPFNSKLGGWLAKVSVKEGTPVVARDSRSAAYGGTLGFPWILQSSDVAFLLPVPTCDRVYDVLLNVSGLLYSKNPHVEFERYRELIVDIVSTMTASGREVSLLAHVLESDLLDSDVYALRDIAADPRLSHLNMTLLLPENLEEVRSMVASARLVIASRMHACLNALSVGTPALALAYSRKFAPLLEDVGWVHVLDLNDSELATTENVVLAAKRAESDEVTLAALRASVAAKFEAVVAELKQNLPAQPQLDDR